jgi:hypothetical protein
MGVRLYPDTNVPEELERLAGVTAGTYLKLQELEALRPKQYGEELDNWYDKFFASGKEIVHLSNFLTYGWGKLRSEVVAYLKTKEMDLNAGTIKGAEAQVVINLQGFSAPEVTAVCWS